MQWSNFQRCNYIYPTSLCWQVRGCYWDHLDRLHWLKTLFNFGSLDASFFALIGNMINSASSESFAALGRLLARLLRSEHWCWKSSKFSTRDSCFPRGQNPVPCCTWFSSSSRETLESGVLIHVQLIFVPLLLVNFRTLMFDQLMATKSLLLF